MKRIALFFALCLTVPAAVNDGNFVIQFEPTAKLQSDVQVPFTINITDDLHKPLLQDSVVEFAIAAQDEPPTRAIKAWFVKPGVFIAKPVFPSPGQWTITVTAKRENKVTSKSNVLAVVP